MMVSIDGAGRVVIPKEVRDRLELTPESQLELDADATGIHLRLVRPPGRIVTIAADGLPVIEAGPGARSTDADLQRWRDGDQR